MFNNQNKFYSSISKFYSEIFPYKPMQLHYIKSETVRLDGKQILDIGCATGELAFNLANEGAKVTGIDLNEDLLNQAQQLNNHKNIKFQVGNMLELTQSFSKDHFDTVLCFGNTLVHLTSTELIAEMLKEVQSVLKPGGQFLIQILNYDYILNNRIAELPLIDSENITFVRKYSFENNNPLINFHTHLFLKKEEETVSNITTLLALTSAELVQLLKDSGFSNIELFSNFKKDKFGGNHLPLVVKCDVM